MRNTKFETWLNTYTVIEQRGEGANGYVYEVLDQDKQRLALKHLKANPGRQKMKRFVNEAHFCKQDWHENIIKVIDEGFTNENTEKLPFIVMPFYKFTLYDLIKERRLDGERALVLFIQMLEGVGAAHLKGVFHRDLKPENILCNENKDKIVIADFGIAHFCEELLATSMNTEGGERLCNVYYAAPEQLKPKGTVDHRADIFALGKILNVLFTFEPAHGANYKKIKDCNPKFGFLDELADPMMDQDVLKRPQTIESVKQRLVALKQDNVNFQKLDELSRRVIPSTAVPTFIPIQAVSRSFESNRLRLQLNTNPDREWIETFHSAPNGVLGGFGVRRAEQFTFSGDVAMASFSDHASQRDFQEAIDLFKNWCDQANSKYPHIIKDRLQREDADRRQKLIKEREAEERRADIERNLKL